MVQWNCYVPVNYVIFKVDFGVVLHFYQCSISRLNKMATKCHGICTFIVLNNFFIFNFLCGTNNLFLYKRLLVIQWKVDLLLKIFKKENQVLNLPLLRQDYRLMCLINSNLTPMNYFVERQRLPVFYHALRL